MSKSPPPFHAALAEHATDPFRLLVDSIVDYAIYMVDSAGVITSWNPGAERVYGYRAEEIIGQSFSTVFIPEDIADGEADARWQEALASGHFESECTRARKDGSEFPALVTASVLTDQLGQHAGFSIVTRDLSERDRRQRALSAELLTERSRLVAAQAVAKVGSWETDLATQQVVWSDESYRIFGQDPARFHPTHAGFIALVHPDDREAVEHAFRESLTVDTPGLIEHRVLLDDGSIKFVEERWQVVCDGDGRAIRVIGTCQDTTERKQAEEELRLRDRAIQAVAQGILVTDPNQPDNPIVFASSGFERMTGYPADDVLGKNCRFMQGRDTSQETVHEMRAAVEASRSCTVEIVNYRKDGTAFWNQITITPVLGPKNQVTHFVGVQTDVTERRRLEEQYRQSQKMEAVGRLAGGVAHDFNNLLTIISGYSELLQTTANLDSGAREAVSAISVASERAAALTRQLLGFSRQTLLQPKVLDLNEVVSETATMLRRLIGEDILLATVLEPAVRLVKVDPGQLNQLLMNLCVNARDAMPKGGKLTIETHNVVLGDHYAQPHLGCTPGPHVMLAISDTGTGMLPEVMGRVFEPFFTTKDVGEGTGLGLAVVFGIVQQSGGCIHVYSEPGRGSSFKVYLPAVSEALSVSPTEEQPSGLHGTETILLVEDEDAVRRLALRSLTMYGYRVLSATDGQDGLRIAASHIGSLDMILTDVVMPNLSGPDLVRALTKDFPAIKVVFMSGYTDDAVVRHGLIEADMAFIQKPYTPIGLVQKVRSVLDGR
jgi:PAS domain S-box-containing protein